MKNDNSNENQNIFTPFDVENRESECFTETSNELNRRRGRAIQNPTDFLRPGSPAKMKLILDERETALYEKCLTLPKSSTLIVEKSVLPLGDAILKTDDDSEITIIERKSLQDLLASIKDGRYVEQSYRLQNCCSNNPHKIMYIIEGVFAQLRNPVQDKKTIFSSMASLNIFKGFSVIRTSCLQETAEWIMALSDKVERCLSEGKQIAGSLQNAEESTANVKKYCEVVKKVKKENITPENMGEIILCQIPSVSSVSSIAVMKEFKSIANLIDQIRKDATCLDKIICESNGKSRKISKSVVQNIKDYLVGI